MRNKLYDAEIEYLESNGPNSIDTLYIPTGYGENNDNKLETALMVLGYKGSGRYIGLFSAYTSEHTNAYRAIRGNGNDKLLLIQNGTLAGGGLTPFGISLNVKYNIVFDKNAYIINNRSGNFTSRYGTENTSSIQLFGSKTDLENYPLIRLYYFKWTKGDKVILDLIPVRKGNIGYLYDKVSKRLFGNEGTGEFILGPDIINWGGEQIN